MLTQKRLKELYKYDLESGNFYRLFSGHGKSVGGKAGCINHEGYIQIKIDKRVYRAHRLVWLYVYGHWPKQEIDHIDRNKLNNCLINLRDVSKSLNQQNHVKARVSNKSTGVLGARRDNRYEKFYASIRVNGKNLYLGCFNTIEEAKKSYDKAKNIYHINALVDI